ncbi:uncharacterized protein LOC128146155 isoform X2 [Harpia harpyja]|uniref:uncharacterized protein LOC128146155 isoform X2 n=1 Tax=Harpia harpyja TaxID=202280 RepID=UPI0022B1CAB5|nr:uncharacterized protein LOC128146155 isoform X2 [Harpia harpyja]
MSRVRHGSWLTPHVLTQSKNMTNPEELITNIELCSKADGYSTVTFPTLKKLSVNDVLTGRELADLELDVPFPCFSDVTTIWSSVSKYVRQQLLKRKPRAVRVTGLGTFHLQKWLSFENGEVLTFQRPVFLLSRTVAQIRGLQCASVPVPGEIKQVSVNYKKIHSDVPYSEEVVQNCMQETLNFFYFILTNREDTDFILKDIGTLAIRGTEVTMAFCEDFLLSLNESTYVVEKLFTKKWVISDKEATLSLSRFGRVHQFPQFEIRAVPRTASLTDEEICAEFESALSSMGIRAAVRHTLRLLQTGVSPDCLARAEMEEEAEEKMEGKGPPGRLFPGRQHKEPPFESPELPLPTSEEHRQTGQKEQSVFGLNGRRKLEASMAKRKEKEENRKAGRLPQQQAGRESDKMQRAQTKVSISEKDLEDVVIFLTSSKPGNFISLEDLIDCQKQWLEMRKGQSQETKTGVGAQFQKATCKTATCLPSSGGTAKGMKPHAPTKPERKLIRLELPPVNTEPERRHLSCDEMEEIGKNLRERRRWEKNKDSPIERKEKRRMVRSGDGPIDEHCLPSTVEADLGELVDRYRRNAVTSYLKSSKLCKERNVHIAEPALQKALLHPGDKIIKEGEDIRKIRQPGGYYSTGRADASSPGSTSRSGTASGSQAKEAENRHPQRSKMQKSSDNNFWPGHLLDKLCLYFPEKKHDRAHALFSYVHPTKPAYCGI